MYLATQILKTTLVPALVLLPAPDPGVQRDLAQDIGQLQRAECEYRGISASFDEVTRAYILQAYEGGEIIRWQAEPSPYNPESETLITAVFTASGFKESTPQRRRAPGQASGVTWRYSTLAATRVAAHGDYAQDAMAVFRQTVDDFVNRMVYAPLPVDLRADASPDAAVQARVKVGEVLLVEEERAGWLRLRHPSADKGGWVSRDHIRYVDNPHAARH